jgi:adenylate cyclase
MPAVMNLSESELAERSGTTPEQIHRLAEVGILVPDPEGGFRLADVQRVRLAEACERGGISLEDMGKAIASGHLSFSFLDLVLSDPRPLTDTTYGDLSRQLGWSFEFMERSYEAMGLPIPLPDQRIREDEAEVIPATQFILAAGIGEESVARVLRVYAENLARIAQAEAQFYHSYVEMPMLKSGMSELDMLTLAAQMSPQMQQIVENVIRWLYRRHQEHYILEHVVEHVETALDDAGVARERPVRPPAMVFLDLAGYTRLTEERGDEAAAELAARLAGLVQTESRRRGGRPVKWLGDGVMFHFPDPDQAIACAIDLVERAPAVGMPPAHCGVNAGPVVFRDGDYFGRTVNIAARIAARAGPGEVLASEETVPLVSADGIRFDEVGPVELKGVSKPVVLYRAMRSDAPRLQSS